METFKNRQMQNKPSSVCEYKHWHLARTRHAVTGGPWKICLYPPHTRQHTHTHSLLLVLQYLQQLPFTIFQLSRWANLSGLGLAQGMVTQRAARYFFLKDCYDTAFFVICWIVHLFIFSCECYFRNSLFTMFSTLNFWFELMGNQLDFIKEYQQGIASKLWLQCKSKER